MRQLCFDCVNNLGDGCTQSMGGYPFRQSCSGYKYDFNSSKSYVNKQTTAGEFKIYSQAKPNKCLKYAYFPK